MIPVFVKVKDSCASPKSDVGHVKEMPQDQFKRKGVEQISIKETPNV